MFDTIWQFGNDSFNWLDNFGHDHWGFILAFVFFWWLANRLLLGAWQNVLFYQGGFNWMRMRRQMRMPQMVRTRPNLGNTGFGHMTNPQPSVGLPLSNTGRRDLNSWSDMEIANQLSGNRLDRISHLRGHLSIGD